jgi:hypothetical protein
MVAAFMALVAHDLLEPSLGEVFTIEVDPPVGLHIIV